MALPPDIIVDRGYALGAS